MRLPVDSLHCIASFLTPVEWSNLGQAGRGASNVCREIFRRVRMHGFRCATEIVTAWVSLNSFSLQKYQCLTSGWCCLFGCSRFRLPYFGKILIRLLYHRTAQSPSSQYYVIRFEENMQMPKNLLLYISVVVYQSILYVAAIHIGPSLGGCPLKRKN